MKKELDVKFENELEIFQDIKSTFIIEGNIYDVYPFNKSFVLLNDYLHRYLKQSGYQKVIFYNVVNGFYNKFEDVEEFIKEHTKGKKNIDTLIGASEVIKEMITSSREPVAIINEYSSRNISDPERMNENEIGFFLNLLYSSQNAKKNYNEETKISKRNLMFFITDKINDLPPWLYFNNPYVKLINISYPDNDIKKEFIEYRKEEFYKYKEASIEEKKEFEDKIIKATGDFKCMELDSIKKLSVNEKIPIQNIKEAIFLYKYGVKENPWEKLDKSVLERSEEKFRARVKGQEEAIEKAAMIIRRATSGLSGMQHSSNSMPKGKLFFAGPTGVGKTELAKAIAELVFGDENNVIRFDMSEYNNESSEQRLFGAPPGYTGYEAGGQLTNAIKKKPFSILLFDEIEKAAPSILDKFLQILEDGRMTDGQGTTVYFTETLIIFTSNLGVVEKDKNGLKTDVVTREMNPEEVKAKVTSKVEEYFKYYLGRPELLGRIGKNNIVVFNFIDENVAIEIMDKQINHIISNLKKGRKIKNLEIGEEAYRYLVSKCRENLDEGGRGIGNQIEKYFLNPLADYIFYNEMSEKQIIVKNIIEKNNKIKLECEEI